MRSVGRARQPRPGASAAPAAIIAPDLLAQQRAQEDDYRFLVGSVIDAGTLELARVEAARCGVATHEALLAYGSVSATAYAAALARALVHNDPALPAVLLESAVELRTLATPESERIPKRLHAAAEKGPVLQSTDVRTLLKAVDLVAARPDGAAASAEVMALLREELDRDRITREVIIEVRDRLK